MRVASLRWVACWTLLLPVAAAPAIGQLEATYLANEGFLLAGGERKVLIDALFEDGIPPYAAVPQSMRQALERAETPFDGVDLVLATHAHDDHYSPAAVARLLRSSPRTRFLSTPDAVARLEPLVADLPGGADRITAVYPGEGQPVDLRLGDVDVRVFRLHHGRARPEIQNLGFRVELGGVSVLHVGDTEASAAELKQAGIGPVDLAFLPYWLLETGESRDGAVLESLGAPRLVLMHLPPPGAPELYYEPYGASFGETKSGFLHAYPGSRVFERAGETLRLPRPARAQSSSRSPRVLPAVRERLAPGRFLVAKREMLDPNFAESVVLLIDQGPDGALGIVVNRPSELRLSAISSEIEGFRGRRDPIYVGGPVPGGRIFVLIHGEQSPIEDTVEVVDRVHLSREESALEQLAGIEDAEFRVYVGYAGWAPGQLENEVLRGDWHVLPARDDWIFAPSPDEMWGELVPPEPSRQASLR